MPSLREKMEFLRPHVAMLGKAAPIVQAMMEWIDEAEEAMSSDWEIGRVLALLDAPIKD